MRTLTILFLLITFLSVFAETVTLLPTDDMYSDPDHAGTSPVVTELWTANFPGAGHFERIMMKFDLTEYESIDLNSAVLHLTRFFSCPTSGTTSTNFYPITENWDETTWDHTQHIQYEDGMQLPFVFSGPGDAAIVEFDVDITELVSLWLDTDFTNSGFVIVADTNQKFSKFYSKESSNENYRPYLQLDFEEINADPATIEVSTQFITNYPNPFNPTTTISFSVPLETNMQVCIYNMLGKKVVTLADEIFSTGDQHIIWNGTDGAGKRVSSGVYFCKLVGKNVSSVRKLMLMK